MARVRIEPGGKVLITLVVFGALLFLFFELKPASTDKTKGPAGRQAPIESETTQAQARREPGKPVSESVPGKPRPQSAQYPSNSLVDKSPIRIYFDFNRAGINKNVYCIFDRIERLVRNGDRSGLKIVVEGNADSIGPSWYNVILSKRRASRVADSLSKRLGVPLKSISVVANGSTKPIASNSTRDGRADNRRTDVVIQY